MLRVITYHRIARCGDNPGLDPGLISATPDVFAAQLDYLRRYYDVVSAKDVLDAAGSRIRLSRRAALLTFDDAYVDFATEAWPILRHFGLPATLFVPTAYAGDPRLSFWWDRLYRAAPKLDLARTPWLTLKGLRAHIKTLPHREALALVDRLARQAGQDEASPPSVIGWPQLRQLAAQGVTLAAHTRSHPILSGLSSEEMQDEVIGSQEDIKRETGSALPIFCYPSGVVDGRVIRILDKNNFVIGFTTQLGHNNLKRSNLFLLRRTDITMRTTQTVFKLRLSVIGNYIDRWRQ